VVFWIVCGVYIGMIALNSKLVCFSFQLKSESISLLNVAEIFLF